MSDRTPPCGPDSWQAALLGAWFTAALPIFSVDDVTLILFTQFGTVAA